MMITVVIAIIIILIRSGGFPLTWVAKLLNVRATRLMVVFFYFNGSVC